LAQNGQVFTNLVTLSRTDKSTLDWQWQLGTDIFTIHTLKNLHVECIYLMSMVKHEDIEI
jgi:hypothetical protein